MTVASLTREAASLTNGITRAFPVSFKVLVASDLVVTLETIADGTVRVLTEGVDYTIEDTLRIGAASVVTIVAWPAGYILRRRRVTQRVQGLDLVPNDGAPADAQEDAYDRAILIAQEIDAEAADIRAHAVLAPPLEAGLMLAPAVARANSVFAFDALGRFLSVGYKSMATAIAPYIPAILGPAYRGDPGPSNNTRADLATLRAAAPSDLTSLYDGSLWTWTPGDFTNRVDDLTVVAANAQPIAAGAWVRQPAKGIVYRRPDAAGVVSENIEAILGESVRIKAFGAKFDVANVGDIALASDDTAAWNAALAYLASKGGGTLQLPPGASKVTAQIDVPMGVPIRIVGTGCRKVYPGKFAPGAACPSTVVPVHAGRCAFRFIGTAAGQGRFSAETFNLATLETGAMPGCAFGWETQGGFLYGFSFWQMGVHGFASAFDVYRTGGGEAAIAALAIEDCVINRNSWIVRTASSQLANGLQATPSTLMNHFRFVNNKAGQNGYLPGQGGISIGGHDVVIANNVMESNRNAVVVKGFFSDIEVKGNYFENVVGRACIELFDLAGPWRVGPNNWREPLPMAGAADNADTGAFLSTKVLISNCCPGECVDPYWSNVTHKMTLPLTGNDTGNSLNNTPGAAFFIARADRLSGANYAERPAIIANTALPVPGNVVREINPQTGELIPVQDYTTSGAGLIGVTTGTITGDAGQWLVMTWLLRRVSTAGNQTDPYLLLLPNNDNALRRDIIMYRYHNSWRTWEWSLITAATKLTAAMTSITANLYPYGMTPAAGLVSRSAQPQFYVVDTVNKVLPWFDNVRARSVASPPLTGDWLAGDRLGSSDGSESGAAGAKYVTTGFQCTASGTPGTWVPIRAPTGN